jgi:predicted CXXCH cytochrome family protein
MRYGLPLALLAALLAWAMALHLALGEQGKVIGSQPDGGPAAYPAGVSACETCHLPHDASGEPLWAEGPYPEGAPFSGTGPLCYSCHDGTVTPNGAYAFDPGLAQHPIEPGKAGEDCDMCHDPHVPDYSSFLLFPDGSNLCRVCHASSYDRFHALNVNALEAGYVPEDGRFSPNDGDFSGTRLWDASGSHPGDYLKCLSCHTAHGAVSDAALLTMRFREATSTVSPLCQNCHG